MDCVRKDIEAVIEEEHKEKYDERQDAELDGSSNLYSREHHRLSILPTGSHNPTCHCVGRVD